MTTIEKRQLHPGGCKTITSIVLTFPPFFGDGFFVYFFLAKKRKNVFILFSHSIFYPTTANPLIDSKYLQSGFHTSVAGLATVVSLLAFDFTIAFLPISVDLVTLIVISLVLCFFIVEIILTSLADPKYKVTFF